MGTGVGGASEGAGAAAGAGLVTWAAETDRRFTPSAGGFGTSAPAAGTGAGPLDNAAFGSVAGATGMAAAGLAGFAAPTEAAACLELRGTTGVTKPLRLDRAGSLVSAAPVVALTWIGPGPAGGGVTATGALCGVCAGTAVEEEDLEVWAGI